MSQELSAVEIQDLKKLLADRAEAKRVGAERLKQQAREAIEMLAKLGER